MKWATAWWRAVVAWWQSDRWITARPMRPTVNPLCLGIQYCDWQCIYRTHLRATFDDPTTEHSGWRCFTCTAEREDAWDHPRPV